MSPRSTIPPGQKIPTGLPGLADQKLGPMTPSPDNKAMQSYWDKAEALLDGQDAVKAHEEAFLPKFPDEQPEDYTFRLANAKLTNVFADIMDTLAGKPFEEELQIVEGSASTDFIGLPVLVDGKDEGKRVGGLIEDIDGKGTHMSVFARWVFLHGIANAYDCIFVDYPDADPNMTAAQEKANNIRPYWYRIAARDILDIDFAWIGGKEVPIYVRFPETKKFRQGFTTVIKQRVREIIREKVVDPETKKVTYGDPKWFLYEKQDDESLPVEQLWKIIEYGTYTIGEIPLVPFITGRRKGSSWQFTPALRSAVDLQMELYQQETGLKNASVMTCYPMLSANGVNLKDDKGEMVPVVIGPHTVLNAPPSGDGQRNGNWEYVEPTAEGLKFVASQIEVLKADLRELGRQPLTAQSTNITVITSAFASTKSNSAIKAWALMLKDALENACLLTAKWLKEDAEPEIDIHLDWQDDLDDQGQTNLDNMRKNGDLSQETYWSESKRKGTLGPDFNADEEKKRLAKEVPSANDLLAAAGHGPLDPANPNNPPKPGDPPKPAPQPQPPKK